MKFCVAILALALAAPATAMDLKSHDIVDGGQLGHQQVYPDCNGDNVSPQLSWSGAPPQTKSFAVTLYDPDARPAGFWHWIVFDIPVSASGLQRGAGRDPSQLPLGSVLGQSDFQESFYGGACPPQGSGQHHYRFTVWALDTAALPFDTNVTGSTIAPYLTQHALAQATLTALYQR
jgi:Raf kinase inhibitor-like YbhB/YbcL family protein